jgi:hypothetical protein
MTLLGLIRAEDSLTEGEAMYRRALATGRQEDPDGFWQATPLYFLSLLVAVRSPSEAAEIAHQQYLVTDRNLGPDRPETASAKLSWMRLRSNSGAPLESVATVLESIEIVRKFPPQSMNRWTALSHGAVLLMRAQRFQEAEVPARELVPILDANHVQENDRRRGGSLLLLGTVLHAQHKDREAADVLEKAVLILEPAGPRYSAKDAAQAEQLLSEARSSLARR